jgi:ParB family transcriptional regulator, chromosome partitioning protein
MSMGMGPGASGASAIEGDEAVSEDGKRRNLGRGLSALFGEESDDIAAADRQRVGKSVPIGFLRPGRFQPRHRFDDDALRALAESIREKGVLQPLLARRDGANSYEIIAGERRWRAAQLAQLHEVPVIIKELDDRAALEIALVENIQRADLTVLEEAEGYRRLMAEFGHTQEALAAAVGKSRSHVANMMRLLALPEAVKQLLDSGALSAGHARALLNATDPAGMAREIVRRGLNVRQAELLAKGGRTARQKAPVAKDADTAALERDLTNTLGLKVAISFASGRGGAMTIQYRTLEQLDDVIRRLQHDPAAARD